MIKSLRALVMIAPDPFDLYLTGLSRLALKVARQPRLFPLSCPS
jgi:hypothetical protein